MSSPQPSRSLCSPCTSCPWSPTPDFSDIEIHPFVKPENSPDSSEFFEFFDTGDTRDPRDSRDSRDSRGPRELLDSLSVSYEYFRVEKNSEFIEHIRKLLKLASHVMFKYRLPIEQDPNTCVSIGAILGIYYTSKIFLSELEDRGDREVQGDREKIIKNLRYVRFDALELLYSFFIPSIEKLTYDAAKWDKCREVVEFRRRHRYIPENDVILRFIQDPVRNYEEIVHSLSSSDKQAMEQILEVLDVAKFFSP